MNEIETLQAALNTDFITRLSKQISLKATPVQPSDFPELDWSRAEAGDTSGASESVAKETQLGFYELQIPCATTNARHDRKLSLVLDLDQTLVHAMKLSELLADAGPKSDGLLRLSQTDNPKLVEEVTGRMIFGGPDAEPRQLLATRLDGEMYLIKLRPGLRQFLLELAEQYELHIYTKANRNYLNFLLYELDPVGKLFTSAVARDDSPDLDTDVKILDRVCCRDMREVVVFDDRVDVWNETPANVVRAQPYNFLQTKKFALLKAFEDGIAGNPSNAALDFDRHLYAIRDVLHKIFNEFVKARTVPAPQIISRVRKEVLKDVSLQFTGFTDMQSHVREAEEFGATCNESEDPAVLVAAKHTKRVYDTKKDGSNTRVVHWSWMEHVRSTWTKPSTSIFDLGRFRVDESGVYPPMDDWEIAYIAANADSRAMSVSSRDPKKRRKDGN